MRSGGRDIRGRLWAEGLIVLQSVIYGFGDPISKIAFKTVPVFSMMSVRYCIAFLVCFLFFRKRIFNTLKTVPVHAWLVPGTCMGLCYLLNNVALSMTDATSVAFLRSLSVIITPAFAFLFFGKKLKRQHLLVQVLVLPGIYMLCVKGGLTCYWQCSGRSNVGFDEWMDMDIQYIKERSAMTDVKIIFKTVGAVLECDGAK